MPRGRPRCRYSPSLIYDYEIEYFWKGKQRPITDVVCLCCCDKYSSVGSEFAQGSNFYGINLWLNY